MRVVLLFSSFVCIASPSFAQARVALSDLVAEAVARNPEIAAAERRVEAARLRPVQERSLPDPMLSPSYSSTGRPWPGSGIGSDPNANVGVMASQQFPYPGKLALKASIAEREADAEAQSIDAARLSVVARVKQAYYRLAYTYAVSDVLDRNREVLVTLLKVSENRYAVGQAAQQDVIKAQTQLSVLELQSERLRRERAAREGDLHALLNRGTAAAAIGRPEDLRLRPSELSLETLLDAARQGAPMLRREQIMIDRAALAVESARAEYKPDFGLSGGYYWMGEMPPMFEVRFEVTLPLRRERRAAAVAEQLKVAEAAQQEYQSTRLDLQGRIQQDYQMAGSAFKLATLYRDTMLPQARLALESSMASYQTGGIDFLSVLTNFASVLEFEMTFYDEIASYYAALSRLEEMTGTPLIA
jgi:outer membrane protein TolC